MTTAELDRIGEEVFARHGARSASRDSYGFPGCLCLSVNDEAVHGIPGERVLRAGDLVKVDVAAKLDGYVADACESIPVGAIDRLRATAEAALRRGIAAAARATVRAPRTRSTRSWSRAVSRWCSPQPEQPRARPHHQREAPPDHDPRGPEVAGAAQRPDRDEQEADRGEAAPAVIVVAPARRRDDPRR